MLNVKLFTTDKFLFEVLSSFEELFDMPVSF